MAMLLLREKRIFALVLLLIAALGAATAATIDAKKIPRSPTSSLSRLRLILAQILRASKRW